MFDFNSGNGSVCVADTLDLDMDYGVSAGKGTQNGLRCRGIPITIRAPERYKSDRFLSLECPLSALEISANGSEWFRLTEVNQTELMAFHCNHENEIQNSTFENWSKVSKNHPLVTNFHRCWTAAPLEPLPNLLDVLKLEIETLIKQDQYEKAKEIVTKNLLQTNLCKEFLEHAYVKGDFSIIKLIQSESEKIKFLKDCIMRPNEENETVLLLQQVVELKYFLKSNDLLLFVLKNYKILDSDSQEKIKSTKTERGWGLYHIAVYNKGDEQQIIELLCKHNVEGINWKTSSSQSTPYKMAKDRELSTEVLHQLKAPERPGTIHSLPQRTVKIEQRKLYGEINTEPTSPMTNISMMVLGGFIAAVGITAVAIAFTLLNAATFCIVGLIVAGIGVTVALSGMGLFANGAYKNKQTISEDLLDFSDGIALEV